MFIFLYLISFLFFSFLFFSFLFFSSLFFLFISINCFVVESEKICVALDEFGCSFDHRFQPWTTLGLTAVYSNRLSPPSLYLPSFPNSFCSPFAPLSLAHSNCREMIRCHSFQVRYEHSGLFSLLSGIVPASTSSISTHHPTSPHLFLPLTTLEDILMMTFSNKGQPIQRERTDTEKEEEMNAHMWTLGQLLVQYPIIRILLLFYDVWAYIVL